MLGVVLMVGRFGKALRHALRSEEFRGLCVAAVMLIATGTIVYMLLEHWSLVNSFYFAVSTLTTTSPTGLALHHTISKLFTALYVLLGVTIIFQFARGIATAYANMRREKQGKPPLGGETS
jgi:voltage-gated potassium channel